MRRGGLVSIIAVVSGLAARSVAEPVARNIREFTEFLSKSWDAPQGVS